MENKYITKALRMVMALMVSGAIVMAGLSVLACGGAAAPEAGVSAELAKARKAAISELIYELAFDIPECKDSAIGAVETIRLKLDRKMDVVLDFREDAAKIKSLSANGKELKPRVANEHIVISGMKPGENEIHIEFEAGEQSLNRRDSFLYTLLVPDRARTLFPCFEQPDLKACYTLTLTVPEKWTAISNTYREGEAIADGRKTVQFAPTEPLSTYLFSFVAGEFQAVESVREDRKVIMYHRETDAAKVAQCEEVLRLVAESLDYMEEWTQIKYPFAKYDFVVIPDFQYGGMEHTGATLYNDRRIFLSEHPTTEELLGRASLIAHETAHMWFGDYVTMRWFDDVWTKEVFANWFAAQMARPAFPDVNHTLDDLKSLYASSYTEDRTAGSNAIQRPLDNLSNAGLIYCNIIYDKAPIVMDMLAKRMGAEAFQAAVREYLHTFAYANASWDELAAIFDKYADFDVMEWSRVWVKEPGMPVFDYEMLMDEVVLRQNDPFGNGNLWQQEVDYAFVNDNTTVTRITASFNESGEFHFPTPKERVIHVVPNVEGTAYGCFMLARKDIAYMQDVYEMCGENVRMSMLMNMYENVYKGLGREEFVRWCAHTLKWEPNSLILGSMLSYASWADAFVKGGSASKELEQTLLEMSSDTARNHELRLLTFRQLYKSASSPEINEILYGIWKDQSPFKGLHLGETDYTAMAYQLMLRFPDRAANIKDEQLSRISNPDRRETFSFVCQAVSPDESVRESLFQLILTPEGRRPESRALTALGLLISPYSGRQDREAYILPALEVLEEVQRTGDIFLPASWCKTLLAPFTSFTASKEVQKYLDAHPELNPLLRTKVLQASGHLPR
ncbi:MAG: M1 family aminopeptidase [Bacteroidales bacterium]|nr:M1 family aminopeptidase [Bacteroidales bacterium]